MNNLKIRHWVAVCVGSALSTAVTSLVTAGGLHVYDLEDPDQRQAFNKALNLRNKTVVLNADLNVLNDFGYSPFDGPLGKEGSDLIPPEFFQWATIDSNLYAHGGDELAGRGVGGLGLLALGPSAGWGNTSNALMPNFAEDSLDIYRNVSTSGRTAFELSLVSIGGSGQIDLTVWTERGERATIKGLEVGPEGHQFGVIWLRDQQQRGEFIERMNLYDPGGGYEGFTRIIEWNTPPAPGTFAVLAFAGVIGRSRRRQN